MDNYFNLKSSSGIKFNDLDIGVDWQLNNKDITLSDKDKNLQYLNNK